MARSKKPQKPFKSKPRKSKSGGGKDWLTPSGKVNKRLKIAKYLTKDGRLRKNIKLPYKAKTVSSLYQKLYPSKAKKKQKKDKKTFPAWFTKKGEVRKVMLKWLTKKGRLRKGVKLPKGVKTIPQLWDWVQSGRIKEQTDESLKCVDLTLPYWIAKEDITKNFKKYRKVFMGGRQITFKTWMTNGADYINEITDFDASPPECTITICAYKKRAIIKMLFI